MTSLLEFMRNTLLTVLLLCCAFIIHAQVHPVVFQKSSDFKFVAANLKSNPIISSSYENLRTQVDSFLNKDIDVPVPKDPAGAYTHEQHKSNYTLMYNAGLLYQITGNKKYAELAKQLFLKYAQLNPTLKNHPQATSAFPGRLFWQALNDANWLVYTGISFDCIYNYLTPAERATIANGAFKPIVDYFIHDQKNWFNLIHNHAVWAAAGVGIVGIATDNQEYLNVALKGTELDGKSGFWHS